MEIDIYIVLITFVVVVIIICLAESFTVAALIVSVLANFLVLAINLSDVSFKSRRDVPTGERLDNKETEDTVVGSDEKYHMYGKDYDEHRINSITYETGYNAPKMVIKDSPTELVQGADEANAIMAQRRARDKKCIDGVVTKTADYYKIHFDDELAAEEAKPWWGHTDY